MERYAGGARPVTDDRPRLEYASWVRRQEFTRVLPRILDCAADPPLLGADESFRTQLAGERNTLLGFYDACLAAYQGDRQLWARSLERVMTIDRQNRYY